MLLYIASTIKVPQSNRNLQCLYELFFYDHQASGHDWFLHICLLIVGSIVFSRKIPIPLEEY